MVLCKYFLEGICKYGSRCRFEHDEPYYDTSRDPTNDRSTGKSILKATVSFGDQQFNQVNISTFGGNVYTPGSNSSFGKQCSKQDSTAFGNSTFGQDSSGHMYNQGSNVYNNEHAFNHQNNAFNVQGNYQQHLPTAAFKYNIHDVMDVVSKDILISEKGSQWPLSAYSPHKDLPNLPGLEDYMPEELRWECYKALQNGTLPLYQVIMQQLYSNVEKVHNDLKKKDTAYAIISTWLQNLEKKVETPSVSPFHSGSFASQTTNDGNYTFSTPQQTAQVQAYAGASPLLGGSKPGFPTDQNFTSSINLTIDSHAYSEMDQIAKKDLEAFKEDKFTLGSIPTKAPPKVCCNS